MAVKFRNSLIGFNKEDVLNYVYSTKETQTKNEKTIKDLQSNLKVVNDDLKATLASLSDYRKKNEELQRAVDDYKAREADLTRLSESIGRLYLVAKTNTNAIINAANENAEISRYAVDKNMQAAEATTQDLADLENELSNTAQKFSDEIEAIKAKLIETKSIIESNISSIEGRKETLESLIENVDASVNV